MEDVQRKVKEFSEARDWEQFFTPKDLILSLQAELGELAECYQWLDSDEVEALHADAIDEVEDEVADVFIYLFHFANMVGVDAGEAVREKLRRNEERFPVDAVHGEHTNDVTD